MQPKKLKTANCGKEREQTAVYPHWAPVKKKKKTFCEPAGRSEPNAAWSFDFSSVGPQGNKPVSGHLASLGDNEPKQLGVCVLFICLLRSDTHAGLFISPQQGCACADQLTCWCLFSFFFFFLNTVLLEEKGYFLLVHLNLMGWQRYLH